MIVGFHNGNRIVRVSPDIYPPFKGVMTRHYLLWNGAESCQGTSLAVCTPLYTLFTIHSLPSFYFAYIHLLLFGYHLNLSCSQ